MGPTGPQGAKGDKGDTGATGPQGPAGASPFGLNAGNAVYTAGSVGIGVTAPKGPLHVRASEASTAVDQSSTPTGTAYYFSVITQSVTAGVTGKLSRIYVDTWQAGTGTLRIYAGAGTGGTLLHTQDVATSSGLDVALSNPVALNAGDVFTFSVTFTAAVGTNFGQYAGGSGNRGSSSASPGDDFYFFTYMTKSERAFLVQNATGYIGVGTEEIPTGRAINTSTGAYLSTGGTWTNTSDVNLKTNFAATDPRDVLEKIASLPVQMWSYKADPTTRHIGPMAQDFYRVFGLGQDDRHISTVDQSGVALAAIQALHQAMNELKQENAALRARVDALAEKR